MSTNSDQSRYEMMAESGMEPIKIDMIDLQNRERIIHIAENNVGDLYDIYHSKCFLYAPKIGHQRGDRYYTYDQDFIDRWGCINSWDLKGGDAFSYQIFEKKLRFLD